jgi:ubiquinone/menaquinone biosynthesis C-methylase UbiE
VGNDRFQDHFSESAADYARYRLTYPAALYEQLSHLAPEQQRCWDCATGSGQAALGWAEHFDEVIATDASAEQLARAAEHPRVRYCCEVVERSPSLEDGSVDLISVAAAIHWFELERFYAEVRRVARPGALLAAWSYGAEVHISPGVDALLQRFVDATLDAHWPALFHHVRTAYRELSFPFEELTAPALAVTVRWTLDDLLGNIRTWSGVRACAKATGSDPVAALEPELVHAWGERAQEHDCTWPLFFRLGRVSALESEPEP